MKSRYKALITLAFVCSLCLAALSACTGQEGPGHSASPRPEQEQGVVVLVTVQTEDKLAGLHCEYTINGTLTGGQAIQPLKTFTPGEEVPISLPPDPDHPPESEPFPFGLYLAAVTEDGTEIPVPMYYQWEARLDTPRRFTLQGSAEAGYTLTPEEADGLTATSFAELPAQDLPF